MVMNMDKIDKACELFRKLESGNVCASDVARRAFCIQDRLASC